jgi:O-antigen/teichoic acid export membrane protein
MRSKNALRNALFSLLYEIILIAFGLIMPKLIINTFGSSINGLTSTISQILQILSLLQAGAVGASIFQMYKPVSEKNYDQISVILGASKKYFIKIGFIFVGLTLAVSPILAFTKSNNEISAWDIALSFIILGLNGSLYMFFISWYDILFSSHQKRFLLSIGGIIEKLVYYALLLIIIRFKIHFIFMYISAIIGSLCDIVFLNIVYSKQYKQLMIRVPPNNNFKIKNKEYLLCNQIAVQATDSMPTILIASIYNLKLASVYGLYNLVQNMIKMVIKTIQFSISEVFGNVTVSESESRINSIYDLLEFMFFLAGIILCTCAMFLFMPFIFIYTNSNTFDINYMYPMLALLMAIYSIVYCMYMPCYTLSNVYGLFRETYLQAIISAVIGFVIAVGFGIFYWPLVLLGPIFYYLSSIIYRTWIIKKHIKWFSVRTFIRRIVVAILLPACSFFASNVFYESGYPNSWTIWLKQALACGFFTVILVGVYVLIFEREEFISLLGYGKNMLKRR